MFKVDNKVLITNKKWKNFGKTAVILSIDNWDDMILIKTCETGWVKWCYPSDIEPVKKSSVVKNAAVDNKPEKSVPFIFFPTDMNDMSIALIKSKIENDHDDTTVLFGDTFENMKDKIINNTNDSWGYEEWNNIYVVSGEDYYHIGKEVVVKKL